MTPLVIATHLVNDGVLRLELTGEIDLSNVEQLAEAIDRAIRADKAAELILDFTAVSFLDSTAINALIGGRRLAREHGATYRITNVRGEPHRVLQITGVLDLLTHQPR